jgi:hypothetical protein
MKLEAYLISKKIDPVIFHDNEPALWKSWEHELEDMHPASFTAQKLYLINPIRRKYPLKSEPASLEKAVPPSLAASATETVETDTPTPSTPKPIVSKPAIPRPVFKPKPKTS